MRAEHCVWCGNDTHLFDDDVLYTEEDEGPLCEDCYKESEDDS